MILHTVSRTVTTPGLITANYTVYSVLVVLEIGSTHQDKHCALPVLLDQ